jgi:ribose transport system permease protein
MNSTPRRLASGTATRAVLLLIVVILWLMFTQPDVLSQPALTLSRSAVVGIVALGLTPLIIQGELDLSVGSVAAAAGGVLVIAPGPLPVQILFAVLFGVVVGLVNGLMVTRLGLNSFIATLGTMIALRGVALMFTDGRPAVLPNADAGILFTTPEFLGISVKSWIFILVLVLVGLFLSRTRAGRDFFAIGGNREAARSVGIKVPSRTRLAFMATGGLAALAGAVDSMSLGSADPTAGETVLLAGVSAAVIGGALLTGGRGSAIGTALGAISLAALAVGLGFAGADPSVQLIVTGAVLFVAIVTDRTLLSSLTRSYRRVIVRGASRSDSSRTSKVGA